MPKQIRITESRLREIISEVVSETLSEGGSGIKIKEENRGKLKATMRRTGKTAKELAHSKNETTRKRAQFALNARKWNHKH